ncbi:MAG TPA: hypothetical protein VIH90_06175, partial [Candidatus Saccharimonadales bacterium]
MLDYQRDFPERYGPALMVFTDSVEHGRAPQAAFGVEVHYILEREETHAGVFFASSQGPTNYLRSKSYMQPVGGIFVITDEM